MGQALCLDQRSELNLPRVTQILCISEGSRAPFFWVLWQSPNSLYYPSPNRRIQKQNQNNPSLPSRSLLSNGEGGRTCHLIFQYPSQSSKTPNFRRAFSPNQWREFLHLNGVPLTDEITDLDQVKMENRAAHIYEGTYCKPSTH